VVVCWSRSTHPPTRLRGGAAVHAVRIDSSSHWWPRAIASVIAGIVIGLVAVGPASAQTTPLQLKVLELNFTSYACRPDQPLVCDVTITGPVISNLGHGTADYTVVLTWEGFEGSPCNTVDETTVFTFDTGTITTHAVHRDCPATIRPGPRIMGSFTVVGGTGAFEGIMGSGHQVGLVYHGEMTL
jgi:hypothetical protein